MQVPLFNEKWELGAYGTITALVILKMITSRNKDNSFLSRFPGLICQSIIAWTKAVSIGNLHSESNIFILFNVSLQAKVTTDNSSKKGQKISMQLDLFGGLPYLSLINKPIGLSHITWGFLHLTKLQSELKMIIIFFPSFFFSPTEMAA